MRAKRLLSLVMAMAMLFTLTAPIGTLADGEEGIPAQDPVLTDSDPAPAADPEPASEPEPAPAADPEPASEPEPAPAAEPDPAPAVDPEPASEPEPAPAADPEPASEPDSIPAPAAEPDPAPAADPEPASEPEPAPAVDPEPATENELEPASEPDSIPVPAAEPDPAPVPEPEPAPAADPEPAPVSEGEPASADAPDPEEGSKEPQSFQLTITVLPKDAEAKIKVYTFLEPAEGDPEPDYTQAAPLPAYDQLKPGAYHYIVTAEGYRTAEADFSILDADLALTVQLEPDAAPEEPYTAPEEPYTAPEESDAAPEEPAAESIPLRSLMGAKGGAKSGNTCVARAGEIGYEYLEDAVACCGNDPVLLLDDVTESVFISEGKSVELNLNGHTLTVGDIGFFNEGTVKITGSGIVTSTAESTISNSGQLIVASGATIENATGKAITNAAHAQAKIKGVVQGRIAIYLSDPYALTVEGGTLCGEEHDIEKETGAIGTITVTSGTFRYDPSGWLDPIQDYLITQNDDGTYAVQVKATEYAVSVDSPMEHGTVSADLATAVEGDTVTLTVVPEEGYALSTLTYTPEGGEAVAIVADVNGAYTFTMPAANVTVTATWSSVKPVFALQNLALGEQIGVRFWMDLSMLSETEKASSQMTFAVSGKDGATTRVPYASRETTETYGGKAYAVFRCTLNAIQMADRITATFAYAADADGQTRSVSTEYSIQAYITGYDAYVAQHPDAFPDAMTDLVHALANYGHYAQPFLASIRGWTCGDESADHREMTTCYGMPSTQNALNGTSAAVISDNEDVGITYALYLDSKTGLRVFFQPKNGYAGDIAITVDNQQAAYTVTSQTSATEAGWYQVQIKNIRPSELAAEHTVTATTNNGQASITLSALSYAHALISGNLYADQGGPSAMAALYAYHAATAAYLSSN